MRILNRLPYFAEPTTVSVRGESVRVKPYQIVIQVSITLRTLLEWDGRTPSFPAILDIGHNHHFSIRRSQFLSWTGLRSEALPILGSIRERQQHLPLRSAGVWLHRNVPGTRDVHGCPHLLEVAEGVAIYPEETGPRLPLLGLRALTKNNLLLTLSGSRRQVSLSTLSWLSHVLGVFGLAPL